MSAVVETILTCLTAIAVTIAGFATHAFGSMRSDLAALARDLAVVKAELLPTNGVSLADKVAAHDTQIAVLANRLDLKGPTLQ